MAVVEFVITVPVRTVTVLLVTVGFVSVMVAFFKGIVAKVTTPSIFV